MSAYGGRSTFGGIMGGNPALGEKSFLERGARQMTEAPVKTMTYGGSATKTLWLLAITICTATVTWSLALSNPNAAMPWVIGGAIGGLVMALVTVFKPEWAVVTGPLYAAFEGLFLGAISCIFNQMYPGIVFSAVVLTFGVCAIMLTIYCFRIIRVTPMFVKGMTMAIGAVLLIYMISWIVNMFGGNMPYIHSSGLIGVGFSLAVVVIASLALLMDFHVVEMGVENGFPKRMEWYAAFGIMVGLIWLYIQLLILLAKLQRR